MNRPHLGTAFAGWFPASSIRVRQPTGKMRRGPRTAAPLSKPTSSE